jgi:hypothetical protein
VLEGAIPPDDAVAARDWLARHPELLEG